MCRIPREEAMGTIKIGLKTMWTQIQSSTQLVALQGPRDALPHPSFLFVK